MQTTLYQDWTILSGDSILHRAMKKERKPNVVDYQSGQINTAMSCCKQFRTAIDVGANYGIMSFHMSKRFTNVHAFEIEPNVYNCLETNVKHFNLDNVQIHACGLGDKEQTVSLTYIMNNKNISKGIRSTFGTHVTPNSSGDILVKTMDSFSFTDVDFITLKYSPTGSFIWAQLLGGTGNDLVKLISVDASDNVYVAGHREFSIGTTYFDFFAAKYKSGLVTSPIFTILIPRSWRHEERQLMIFDPDNLPSLPNASSLTPSLRHLAAIALAMRSME
jgi:FkbM family methyltransferase